MKVAIVGIGNMGGAIVNGLIANNQFLNSNLYISNRSKEKLKRYEGVDINICQTTEEAIKRAEIVILAIKPDDYEEWLIKYQALIADKLLVSIAAGINSEFLMRYTSLFSIVMPNIGVDILKGYTLICENEKIDLSLNEVIVNEVSKLFKSVGKVKIIKEKDLIHYTILSGCTPAFIFQILSDLVKSFESFGINNTEVQEVLSYIMSSALDMANNNNVEELVNSVCSPNGVTIEGIKVFAEYDLEKIFTEAITNCKIKNQSMNE